MKHLKTTLLAFVLLLSVDAVMAQVKYDYAIIRFRDYGSTVYVTINDKVQEVEVPKDEVKQNRLIAMSPAFALREVNRLEDEGWELYDNTIATLDTGSLTYVFYMRRKEQ